MSSELDEPPKLGETVYYYDEDKQPHAAIIAHIHEKSGSGSSRPTCNLAIFKRDGRVANRVDVGPAYHDGEKWRLINKWSWPDEVPEDEWSHLPPPKMRGLGVGLTGNQPSP